MTPKEAEADLYNDIIPLQAMRTECDVLKPSSGRYPRSTSSGTPSPSPSPTRANRYEFLDGLAQLCPIRRPPGGTHGDGPRRVARIVIEGLPALPGSLPGH